MYKQMNAGLKLLKMILKKSAEIADPLNVLTVKNIINHNLFILRDV